MALFPPSHPAYWRHVWIRLQIKRWVLPVLCAVPYLGSLLWLLIVGMSWLAQIMLTPLLMALIIGSMTWALARHEFGRSTKTR